MTRLRCVAAFCAALLLSCISATAQDNSPAASTELRTFDIVVAADGTFVETSHAEARATNDAGVLRASQVSVPFNTTMQDLEIVEAYTLKANGTKIPIDVSTIYEQLPAEATQIASVTDLRVKILLFPQFAVGDTAVYTVKLKTTKAWIDNQFSYGIGFPRTGSFSDVKVTITAPTAMGLQVETHEMEFAKQEQGAATVYSWHYAAPIPQRSVAIAVSPMTREPRMFVSSYKDFAALGRAYGALEAQKIAPTPRVQALADQITANEKDRREQSRKIYEWVVKHIRYVAVELGRGSFVPHDADTILSNGYGDCKDHDVLLQSLLKAKDIAAESSLINAENEYELTQVPTFATLNHVITYLPEFKIYLDSTVPAPFGVLPFQEYGKPTIHASPAAASVVTMPVLAPGATSLTQIMTAALDANGVITGTTKTSATGPMAVSLRMFGFSIQGQGPEQAAAQQLSARGYKNASGRFTYEPPMELGPSYSITGQFTLPNWEKWLAGAESDPLMGGLRVFSVTGDDLMGPLNPGELKDEEATPCYSGHAEEDMSLTLPPGTRVVRLPQNAKVETPYLKFSARVTFTNGTLTAHREFTSTIGETLCSGALRKQTAEALKKIAESYEEQILLGRPIAQIDQSVQKNPTDENALIEHGNALLDAGNFEAAIRDYDQVLRLNPANATALDNRGYALTQSGQFERAVKDFDKAIALNPGDRFALINRGIAYGQLEQPETALADFDKAISLEPGDKIAYFNRAIAYDALKKYEQALADFDKVLSLDPAAPDVHGLRGHVLTEMGQYARALPELDKALAENPNNFGALAERVIANLELKNYANAVKDCDRLLALKPDTAVVYMLRAKAKRALGDDYGANRDTAQALKLDPAVGRLWN